LEYLSHIILIF